MGCMASKSVATTTTTTTYPKQHNPPSSHQNTKPTNAPANIKNSPAKKSEVLSDKEKHELCKEYLSIDAKISELEKQNVTGKLTVKQDQMRELLKTQSSQQELYKKATEKVAKEKKDVDQLQEGGLKKFFQGNDVDAKMSKEQEEYLDAVNKAEIAKSRLDGIQSQITALEKDSKENEEKYNKLTSLYSKQDAILDRLFGGQYGSQLENKLETEEDVLEDKVSRISQAKFRWTNANVLLQHASSQMGHACGKWEEVAKTPAKEADKRYILATETRNNLIAAKQNIDSAQRYLGNIPFPYCTPEEMATLEKATNNIYADMQSNDRHQHAMQCYSTTHKRAAALQQWCENVIENTIKVDLKNASKEHAAKELELKTERFRLMSEMTGGDFKVPDPGSKQKQKVATNVPVTQPGRVDGQSDKNDDSKHDKKCAPLSLSELAPPPSQADIFGNVDRLKQKHAKEMAEFDKNQAANKARIEQGLEEKLKERRGRKHRAGVPSKD